MSRPWFPFYVGDYLRDTARLTTEAHGAYLLLMLDYWVNGAPPDDDETLAAITRMQPKAWATMRPKLAPFFQIGEGRWRHKRIEEELTEAEVKHQRRCAAGSKGGKAKAADKQCSSIASSNATGNDQAKVNQPQSQPQKIGGGVECARDAEPDRPPVALPTGGQDATTEPPSRPRSLISEDAFTLADDVLVAMGLDRDDPRSVGAPMTVQTWLSWGWAPDVIVATVKRVMTGRRGPPGTLGYFEKAIMRAMAELNAPPPIAEEIPQRTIRIDANGPQPTSQRSTLGGFSGLAARLRRRVEAQEELHAVESPCGDG